MPNIEQSGKEPGGNEALDPRLYASLIADFSRTVLHPHLSEVLTWQEAESGWPGFDRIDEQGGGKDFPVGRKREIQIVSGPETAEVTLLAWDSSVVHGLTPDPVKGFPVGSLYVQTDHGYDEEHPGALNGLVDLYQLPVVTYDFGHGTLPAPADDTERGDALINIATYLGLNPGMVTGDLTEAQPKDGLIGSIDTNVALESLADGMGRLRRDTVHSNRLII